MQTVRVSAKILHWPQRCAHCLAPASCVRDTSATRTKGVEVVRTDTRTWEVPYCAACLTSILSRDKIEHEHAALDAEADRESTLFWGWIPHIFFTGTILLALTYFSHSSEFAICLLVIAVPVGLWFAVALLGGLSRWMMGRGARANAEDARRRAARHLPDAVRYLGWSGSVHTFEFENDQFAQMFVQSNRGKVL